MRQLIIVLFVGMFFGYGSPCLGQVSKAKRVLFLGNSVFYYRGGLGPSFEGFCREAGLRYEAVSQWHGPAEGARGGTRGGNSGGVEFLGYGRIPLNLPGVAGEEKIHALIREGGFDYVILEGRREGYLLPMEAGLTKDRGEAIAYAKNLEALKSLHRTVVESGAQTVLYVHPGSHTRPDLKLPVAQIYRRLHADLEEVEIRGERREVVFVPALFLWMDGVGRYGVEDWYADENHGNALARYASACLLYTYLTGKDPRVNGYKGLTELSRTWEMLPGKEGLEARDEDAKWVKDQVWLYYSTRGR